MLIQFLGRFLLLSFLIRAEIKIQ